MLFHKYVRTWYFKTEYRFGIIPTRVSSVPVVQPWWLSPPDSRTSYECIVIVSSSHLRGTIERMCGIALHLAQVFVLCQKNGKLLRAFEDLNKRDKAFSFRYKKTIWHRFRGFVSRRICVTKRDRISSSRETNKRLFLRVLFLDAKDWKNTRIVQWYQIKTKQK